MMQIQQGAQDLNPEQVEGATILRNLDLDKFRGFLKRKFTEDLGVTSFDAVRRSQTTLEAAKKANAKLEEEHRNTGSNAACCAPLRNHPPLYGPKNFGRHWSAMCSAPPLTCSIWGRRICPT